MKKRTIFLKIIGIIAFSIFVIGISYVIMSYVEKGRFENTNLIVTFEDNEEFTLENTNKLEKEEALTTYPYIFTVQNKAKSKVSFQVKLEDKLSDNLQRENLDYVILENDKEIKSGNLASVKDYLFQTEIQGLKTNTYKVYIYLTSELEDINYTYSLKLDTK